MTEHDPTTPPVDHEPGLTITPPDEMPRSALATEFVDYVLPAAELPARLLEYVRHPPHRPRREEDQAGQTKPAHALQRIFHLIRAQTGHDFSSY